MISGASIALSRVLLLPKSNTGYHYQSKFTP